VHLTNILSRCLGPFVIAAALAVGACDPQPPMSTMTIQQPSQGTQNLRLGEYRVAPGDRLRVTVVADGAAALEHVHARPDGYDAVLMDVHMPGMDGHAATRALRVLWPALPVIGVTADAMAEDLQRCLDAGMVEVLTKPVLVDRLMAALGRHARRRAAS